MLDLFRTLPGLLDDAEGSEIVREAIVFAAWRRIAGEALAGHTAPIKLKNSTLSVAVANLMWQRQLKDLCGQMLFKLNAALGAAAVSFIELEIDEDAVLRERERASRAATPRDDRESAAEITPELMQSAAKIADEDLRRQFLLAAGSCLARRKRKSSEPSL